MRDYYVTLENGYCAIIKARGSREAKAESNRSFSAFELRHQGCVANSATVADDEQRDWVDSMGRGPAKLTP